MAYENTATIVTEFLPSFLTSKSSPQKNQCRFRPRLNSSSSTIRIQEGDEDIAFTKAAANQVAPNISEEEFKDDFIRKYLRIHLDPYSPFYDRMMFDIYKRRTKMRRFDSLWRKQQKKLPKEVIDERFRKLFEDSMRRQSIQSRVINESRELEQGTLNKSQRKLRPEEQTRVYDENVERKHKRDKKVLEEKKMKEYLEEIQILEQREEQKRKAKEFFKKHNAVSRKESPRLVDRMDADVKRRLNKSKEVEKAKEGLENLQMEEYFVPKINKVILSKETHTKLELNKSVQERLERDLNIRKVKEMLRKEQRNRTVSQKMDETAKQETKKLRTQKHKPHLPKERCRNLLRGTSNSQERTRKLTPSKVCGSCFHEVKQKIKELSHIGEEEEKPSPKKKHKTEKGKFIIRSKAEKLIEQMYLAVNNT